MRLSREQKELLEDAATIQGQDLTSFALGLLLKEASTVIKEYQVRRISERDMHALVTMLKKPAAPNATLRAAFRRLKRFRGR